MRSFVDLLTGRNGGEPTGRRASRPRCRPRVELLEDRNLLSAALDLLGVTALRNDPFYADITGRGMTVAVIDTGVEAGHYLLQDGYLGTVDFVYEGNTAP